MIELIPAISVKYKKVVRMNGYNPNDLVLYNHDPLDWAMKLEDCGIKRILLTDIVGIEQRKVVDTDALEKISGFTDLKVDFGGGIHTEADIRKALEDGADRIFASSVAEYKPEIFASWLITFTPAKIALSLDVLDGKVVYRQEGLIKETALEDVIAFCDENGVHNIYCAMHGLSIDKAIEKYSPLIKQFPHLKFIAATGVQTLTDIQKLQNHGLSGVVFAKALLEEQIALSELATFIASQR
jgi:phosphoribosylformimino-5-aminoimidazole carboxamide ribotide isomerase